MMMQPYHNHYNSKKNSDLAIYCRTERIDPLYIRSHTKDHKNHLNPMGAFIALGRFLAKYMKCIKLSRKPPEGSTLVMSGKGNNLL